jgi:hypothetical protein
MADRLDGHQDRGSGNHPPDDADGSCEEGVDILADPPGMMPIRVPMSPLRMAFCRYFAIIQIIPSMLDIA